MPNTRKKAKKRVDDLAGSRIMPIIGDIANYDAYPQTPNIYKDWLAPTSATAGRRVSFYNENDFALWSDVWQINQYLKPDSADSLHGQNWNYRYVGDPSAPAVEDGFRKSVLELHLGDAGNVRDRYEIMAFAAEARSKALGSVPGVATLTNNLDLQTIWPPDTDGAFRAYSAHKWHSAQFRSTNMRQKDYWRALLDPRGFNIIP